MAIDEQQPPATAKVSRLEFVVVVVVVWPVATCFPDIAAAVIDRAPKSINLRANSRLSGCVGGKLADWQIGRQIAAGWPQVATYMIIAGCNLLISGRFERARLQLGLSTRRQ